MAKREVDIYDWRPLAAGSHFWRGCGARVLWIILDRRRGCIVSIDAAA